ncbi:MAG: RNB domain-containing ribonuclease [Firmicutes bacterium]|nr:RNB domain-containing ribonuclease [Bacillota bacterium]
MIRGSWFGIRKQTGLVFRYPSSHPLHEPRIPNPESRIPGLTPRDFADLLSSVAGLPHETAVSKAVLRAMSKACYLPENLGHFGLAAKNYCHFTSPIRRYPDLWIHRVIKGLGVRGQGLGELGVRNSSAIADIALQSSSREREAEKAERDADELKKAEYMSDKIGMRFFGVIGGVTERGIFVELENTVEGMVRAESLPGTGFSFNERLMTLQAGAHTYRIGDTVEIEVLAVTGSKIEFGLA